MKNRMPDFDPHDPPASLTLLLNFRDRDKTPKVFEYVMGKLIEDIQKSMAPFGVNFN